MIARSFAAPLGRRRFIAALGSTAVAATSVSSWSQDRRPARIGFLGGGEPADLPIERPNIFELLINLDTAAKLRLNLSATLIARADRVIG